MTHDVFISYSAKDKHVADAMCSALESKGIRCWIAPRDILPGMDWGGSIIDAISSSHIMILILSSNSNVSSQVKREVERAVSKEIVVVPFRIEGVILSKSLEYQLSVTHWMDALTLPMEKHFQTLTERIRQIVPSNGSESDIPVRPMAEKPVQAVPPPFKRKAVYMIAGLVISAGLAIALSFGFRPTNSTPFAAASTPTLTSLTSIGKSDQSNPQEMPAAGKSQGTSQAVDMDASSRPRIPVINGKPYDVARKLLIKEGWQPNLRHVSYGGEPEVQFGNGPLFWKKGYWEMETCSGSGLAECLFEFIDPSGRLLTVTTAGEEAEDGKYHASVKFVALKPK